MESAAKITDLKKEKRRKKIKFAKVVMTCYCNLSCFPDCTELNKC